MCTRFIIAGLALIVAVTVLAAYTFLHEGGHALVGLLFGGQVTDFSSNFWDIGAHVGLDGDFSPAQRAWLALAGLGLPLFAFVALVTLLPRRPSASLELFRLMAALVVLNTLLPWIVIPILYLSNRAPADDVTGFLRASQALPLVVAVVAVVFYAAGWLWFFKRSERLRPVWERWRQGGEALLASDSLRDLRAIVALGFAVVSVAAVADARTGGTGSLVPAGYREVARISLTASAVDHQAVHTLTVLEPGHPGLLVMIENVEIGPGEIVLEGAGVRHTLLAVGERAGIGRATVNPQTLLLEPGQYSVQLTFPRQARGQVTIYVKGTGGEAK